MKNYFWPKFFNGTANHIAEQTGAIRIGQLEVVSDPYDEDIQQLRSMITNNEEIPVDMWTQIRANLPSIIGKIRDSARMSISTDVSFF